MKPLLVEENEDDEESEVAAEESGNDDDLFDALLRPDANPTLGVRNQNQTSACINCNFIFGSCAEVERLWQIAKHILTYNRKGMLDLVVFEILIFLKLNRRLWGASDFVDVDEIRKNSNKYY